jgi:hypothetical protein
MRLLVFGSIAAAAQLNAARVFGRPIATTVG